VEGTAKVQVAVRGLTKRFGAVTAVHDLSFEVPAGVTGFLGPNGAGKTTTLRMLLGLVAPTAGTATIGGTRYADLRHPRRVVGALLETSGFHPGRSARQHLVILAGLGGIGTERVDVVLEEVGLTADAGRRVGGYSLGMRQRLGLAGALLGDPEVLVLDEPGNGLDPAGLSWLRGLLRDLARQGRTVIVSSHVLAEVAQTADRVVILNAGTLRYAGPLDELSGPAGTFETLEATFLRLTADRESVR
jgi:ABC-2 type transport system ATP-binding protein